jgi:hypothetical protein
VRRLERQSLPSTGRGLLNPCVRSLIVARRHSFDPARRARCDPRHVVRVRRQVEAPCDIGRLRPPLPCLRRRTAPRLVLGQAAAAGASPGIAGFEMRSGSAGLSPAPAPRFPSWNQRIAGRRRPAREPLPPLYEVGGAAKQRRVGSSPKLCRCRENRTRRPLSPMSSREGEIWGTITPDCSSLDCADRHCPAHRNQVQGNKRILKTLLLEPSA